MSGLLWLKLVEYRLGTTARAGCRFRNAGELAAGAALRAHGQARVDDPGKAGQTPRTDEARADQERLVEGSHRLVVRGERVPGKPARDDDADHGDADEPGDARDGVVDRGG